MTREQAIERFGVDPETIGLRHRAWWIVDDVSDEEERAGALIGDLCVKARDGGLNPIDVNAFKVGNCIGTAEDGFDRTYRYYYYRQIAAPQSQEGEDE